MLRKIYHEQKTINRNIQQITILMLLQMMIASCNIAKKDGDKNKILLCKIGLALTASAQGILTVMNIMDSVQRKAMSESDARDD